MTLKTIRFFVTQYNDLPLLNQKQYPHFVCSPDHLNMQAICSSLKNLFVFRSAVIDTCTFSLHYKLTFGILLALSILVGFRQMFGDVINCITKDSFPSVFVENYCYVHSTYSTQEAWNLSVGTDIPYPGVQKYSYGDTKIYHTYYQWVAIVLFVQAVFFLVPRCFWKHMESGRVQDIIKDLAKEDTSKEDPKNQILRCSTRRLCSELNHNSMYFASYVVAEILNLVNVIAQFYLMDVFLGGHFFSYGQQVLQFSGLLDPGFKLFPGMAQCILHRYGSSGDIQTHSALCLLPLNVLNEKIYAFLWFWFIVLLVVSCLSLVCRLVFALSPHFRVGSLMFGKRLVESKHMNLVVSQISAADCFLLHLISQNIGSVTFRDVISSLAKEDLSSQKFSEDETTLM